MKRIYNALIPVFISSFVFSTTPAKFSNGTIGFIENKGQIHDQNNKPNPDVKYLLCTPGMNIQLKTNSFSYDSYSIEQQQKESRTLNKRSHAPENIYRFHRVDVEFIGANTTPVLMSEGPSDNISNYFGKETNAPQINIKSFSKITYKNLYPNIDLEFIASSEKVKYNFILHSGANINQIKWQYKGSENTVLNNENISINVAHGSFDESIPESYFTSLNTRAKKSVVKVNFKSLGNNVYCFTSLNDLQIGTGETLTIDPTLQLLWATYYGDSGFDSFWGSCVDKLGYTYYAGTSASLSTIASTGAYQVTYGGGVYDAMIVKFDPSGARQWATYFGGANDDQGYGIVLDKANNNLYISGITTSTASIASIGAHQTVYGGGPYDAFLLKLTNAGTFVWSTYYGGNGDDESFYCRLDTADNIYLCGSTSSTNSISTSGAYQVSYGGGTYDGFVAKLNSNGVRQWATYYGGPAEDAVVSCDFDFNNSMYLTGYTKSNTGISTSGSHQQNYSAGADAFLVKFNASGIRKWATYYGGSGTDIADNAACDS